VSRIEQAVRRFEDIHREDPRIVVRGGESLTYSLWYHRRLLDWVLRLDPTASEPLRLAAMCQHIRRWTVPRDTFPSGLSGYKRWRSDLARFHAETAEAILRELGHDEDVVARVRALVLKKGFKTDAEVQLFEDAICLEFLADEFVEFAARHDDPKLVGILRKTWAKMSERGHAVAVELASSLPPRLRDLVLRAVTTELRS
jgi:hypothetical protein